MSVWAALAGGFVGTLVLTTILRAASELRLTRMDLPFLLGTCLTTDRRGAKALGYLAHFGFGFLFALGDWALFSALDDSSWLLGALFGLVHGMFAGTALVNVLLPVVHPHMGSSSSAANTRPLLEAPGFLMLNYGRTTPVVTVAAHVVYGAIVGAFVAAAS
jgi:hypothetical protein